jgi:hypothetical protein
MSAAEPAIACCMAPAARRQIYGRGLRARGCRIHPVFVFPEPKARALRRIDQVADCDPVSPRVAPNGGPIAGEL